MYHLWELTNRVDNRRYYVVNSMNYSAMRDHYATLKYGELANDVRRYGINAFTLREVAQNRQRTPLMEQRRQAIDAAQSENPLYGYNTPQFSPISPTVVEDDLRFTASPASTAKRLTTLLGTPVSLITVDCIWRDMTPQPNSPCGVLLCGESGTPYYAFDTMRMAEKRLQHEPPFPPFTVSRLPLSNIPDTRPILPIEDGTPFALLNLRDHTSLSFPTPEAAFPAWAAQSNFPAPPNLSDYQIWLRHSHDVRGARNTTLPHTYYLDWRGTQLSPAPAP